MIIVVHVLVAGCIVLLAIFVLSFVLLSMTLAKNLGGLGTKATCMHDWSLNMKHET